MSNHVLILTHNNLTLTKRCVQSVVAHDVPIFIYFEDNNSVDGTGQWIYQFCDGVNSDAAFWAENKGVSFGWNDGLSWLFRKGAEHVLCVGNDTILAPWCYRELLSYPQLFVTGYAVEDMNELKPPTEHRTENHPDFSCFLMRREFWQTVGKFDESMVSWASDCDMHVRGHRMGMEMVKVPCPFFHVRSSTLRLAPPEEQNKLNERANLDRQEFVKKWGFMPGTPEYSSLFAPETFGIDRKGVL